MNIVEAMKDPNLFGAHFSPLDTWSTWTVVLLAIFQLPMNPGQRVTYRELTGLNYNSRLSPVEIWLAVGRRGGKSKIVALIAIFLAAFFKYPLSAGEIGHVMVIATDRKQAKIILRYIEAFVDGSPVLSGMVLKRTADSIELVNDIHITVVSCNLRSVRGFTVVAAICDEIAFWRSDESANPDTEVLNAIRPAMSTIPGAKLICLSSPYARRGALYEAYRDYFAQPNDDILVIQAPTERMNPTIDRKFLAREEKRDPASYRSEYLAQFRTDIAAALDPEWIDVALSEPNLDRPRSDHARSYKAFVDMSGGRTDSAALAIAHVEPGSDSVIVSLVRRWVPPFSPAAVVGEMAELIARFGLATCIGDFYGAEITRELFTKAGVAYMRSEDSASDIFLQTLPLFSGGRIEAPDHPILRRELLMLERRTRVSGKDQISHPRSGHDDLAVAMCGAVLSAWRARSLGTTGILFGPPLVTASFDSALVTDFDNSWPRLS